MQTIALTPTFWRTGGRLSSGPSDPPDRPVRPAGRRIHILAPPLGVWRPAGALRGAGMSTHVFDPNCWRWFHGVSARADSERARWDIIGVSTTGMTLPYDLALANLARENASRDSWLREEWRRPSI